MGRYHKKNETVLIVGNKQNASRFLAGEQGFIQGFKTIFACCAEEALQIASKSPQFDMLLTDLLLENNYWMPEINGVQFAQEFARNYPKTKIVFMIL
jgi:CheY-like chemotaxis protein